MPAPIEDYALLSDCRTAALVSAAGSIDWLCLPRYDSPSVFGALLGDDAHGSWSLRPTDPSATSERRYDGDTFILVTRWTTESGVAEVHDFLAYDDHRHDLVRRVIGVRGDVEFESALRLRFDYARALPWVRQIGSPVQPALLAIAGPDALVARGPLHTADGQAHIARWSVGADEAVDSTLTWAPSYREVPDPVDVEGAWERTREWWTDWAGSLSHVGPHHTLVIRSLLVLRALTHRDTGGIVAAATTSLPEQVGGARNWDYRYVWLRDAALTIQAYAAHGLLAAAAQWREWLLRAIAGDPGDIQIMYGVAGERDLPERELSSLPGYDGAAPVRVGNGAVSQWQADVIGEVMVALDAARRAGLAESQFSWALQLQLLAQAAATVDEPDQGIWEIRGEPRMFTHSRVMMWAAFDRGVRAADELGLEGDVELWRGLRDRLRDEIDARGVGADGFFVQHPDTTEVDAALLQLPLVGFCAADDPRMLRTVERIERTLMPDGFVRRYRTASGVDGLAGDENPFVACSFWLVQQYAGSGRHADAAGLMATTCAAANDLGLLSEEYDPVSRHQLGNTPQALSHLALVGAADALAV
ncbi:glycoside hydrolase family 15 protein [Microbacterium sp. P06]|uniref:glycoside hydrolase family 15 protein n=1 Tax=Microbacterium sp. P06 TaxID=3366949 RepID=UPI0037474C12